MIYTILLLLVAVLAVAYIYALQRLEDAETIIENLHSRVDKSPLQINTDHLEDEFYWCEHCGEYNVRK